MFEQYISSGRKVRGGMFATINPRSGLMSLSVSFSEALSNYQRVELHYDPQTGVVGISPTNKPKDSVKICRRKESAENQSRVCYVSLRGFLKTFGLDLGGHSQSFPIDKVSRTPAFRFNIAGGKSIH